MKRIYVLKTFFIFFSLGIPYTIYTAYTSNCFVTDKEYVALAKILEHTDKAGFIRAHTKALAVNPDSVDAHFALAFAYYAKQEYEKALTHFCALVRLYPKSSSQYFNVATTLRKLGRIDESIPYFEHYVELESHIGIHRLLGEYYLMQGDLQKGYAHHDISYSQTVSENSDFLWKGQDVRGKTIYIVDNIGIGDVFCFTQYAKCIKEHGGSVILGVREYLKPLMSMCPYVDKLVTRFEKAPCDYWIDTDRLPRMAYKAGFDIPASVPYLFADETLLKKWGKCLDQDKNFRIGICWETSMAQDKDGNPISRSRSMPLYYFYELSKIPGVSLYSLQQVNGTEQLGHMPDDFKIHVFDEQFDKEAGSFMDTAAVMKHLDLVITVDTSITHLAGALGVPVWMLLNKDGEWRWILGHEGSVWYQTMRIFRQEVSGDWDSAMQKVITSLCEILK